MNFGDSIQETTAGTSTATIIVNGATIGNRTFASGLTVGMTRIPLRAADDAGNWLTGEYTLTNSTTLTRTAIAASSNGGANVTLAGTVRTITCTPIASLFASGVVNSDDVGFDIVILAGQSNMAGRGVIDSLVELSDPRVWQFGCASGDARYRTIFIGNDPIHNEEGVNTGQMSLGTVACKVYANTIPTSRKVLFVPCAHGGTKLYGDTWAVGGALYLNTIAQANLAVTAAQLQYPNSRVVGIFWHQGESDALAGTTQAQYVGALEATIAGFRAGITGASSSWFIIGGMVPEAIAGSPSSYNPIVAAQQQVASETAKSIYVAGPSGYTADSLHYTAPGARFIGARMGLAVQAAAAFNPITPATAVAMSGPTGGVVSTASSNFTISISGVITGTVRCTPSDGGAGGTFTPIFKDLTTGIASGTFTYTPSSTGAKTISLTNNGGLSNPANITYTVTAAATVPGAPTIGTATAGDTTASVAFTAPGSDGGSAITGYTVTSTPGSITASGASSPITITGLTNGTAYTFKVHATNAVGNSAQSAASNSVTPASASLSLNNMGFMQATSGVPGGYEGTTGSFWGSEGYGTLSKAFQNGVDGEFVVQMLDTPNHAAPGKEIGIGIDASSTSNAAKRIWDTLSYFLMHRSDGCLYYSLGSGGTSDTSVIAAINDYVRIKRTGSTLTMDVSHNTGGSYTTVKTITGVPTTAMFAHVNVIYGTRVLLISSSGLA
jgi:hypothetical protein